MGLHGAKLKAIDTYRFNTQEGSHIINQFVRVFLVSILRDTPLKPQVEEVSMLQWFTPNELKHTITEKPETFTPGFLYALRTYFSDCTN